MTAIAEELAKGQKEISVAEFFERNRQVLGFDSPTKALITAVKEAVDNALDACEEASLLPDIVVEVTPTEHKDEFHLAVEDNGPGIVQRNLGKIFGQLLYGSRFHAIRQSRGQQGIGISAVVLYGQLTTGHRALVTSKIGHGKPAVRMEVAIDTKSNRPEEYNKEAVDWGEKEHGTRIEVVLKGRYQGGKQSVSEYLRSTSIVNPHARLTFCDPTGAVTVFERVDDEVPPPTREIKPHPLGTELGTILKMARDTPYRKITTFLQKEFVSVGSGAAKKIVDAAGLPNTNPQTLTRQQARSLHDAFAAVKIMSPPTDCLSPIGEGLIRRGLHNQTTDVSPEFITTVTRPPAVWGGHPFQVEVGVVYGGTLPKDQPVRILRFANRVPLLYQQGACEATLAVQDVDWRRYGLEQRGGSGIPIGPAIVLVHVASTKVPFTNEAKEAVAPMEEIHKELRLALQEAARGLGRHMKKKEKRAKVSEKFTLVTKILPEIARKSAAMLGKPEPDLAPIVCKIMDVVWIDDATAEYERLPGPALAPGTMSAAARPAAAATAANGRSAHAPRRAVAVAGRATLEAFDADNDEAGDDAGAGSARAEAPDDASDDESEAAPGDASDDPSDDPSDDIKAAGHDEAPAPPRPQFLGRVRIPITNYKVKQQKFKLYVVVPDGCTFVAADPRPAAVKDRYVCFDIPAMKPTERREITYSVAGIHRGDLDDVECFVDGISEMSIVGADPWRGAQ
jgi:DNA topoisomerase-6 subunit B